MRIKKQNIPDYIEMAKAAGAKSVTVNGVVIEFGDEKPKPTMTVKESIDDIFAEGILKQEISDEDMLFWSVPLPEEAIAKDIDASKIEGHKTS